MPRSFRFEPPAPRPGSLTRPRLLRALLGRWDHRVTTVVGGPGLGKTTLLAQALAENQLAPRGDDVWLGLGPGDAEGHALARDALAALAAGTDAAALADAEDREPDAASVADAAWRRSPTAVCLVLDDVHVLAPDSRGALWLADLIDALPANAHVVLAGRWAPAVPLARLAAQGSLLRLTEDDLRFSEDELAGFAARRGVEAAQLDESGGWPAMAELAASVGRDLAGEYLWEEILEPLGPERRRVLAIVSDLGGADDALAGAAMGGPVALGRMLDGVPLVAQGTGGWRVPHPLWATAKALALPDDQRRAMRARAVEHLVSQHRYDDAITLAAEAELTDLVPAVLRAASIGPDRPPTRWLERWLADLPPEVLGTPGAALAAGVRAAAVSPTEAAGPLREVIDLCRTAGDVEGELSAIAVLGRVAWWRSDLALLGEIFPRVLELEAEGEPLAGAIAAVGRAVLADLGGDDEAVLAHLDGVRPGLLDDQWQAVTDWLRASVLAGMGDADGAIAMLDGIHRSPDPAFLLTVEGTRMTTRWSQGHVDDVVAALPSIVDRIRAAGVVHNLQVATTQAAFGSAWVGDVESAGRYLAEARQAQRDAGEDTSPRLTLAEAACLLAGGDEPGAAAVIEAAARTLTDPNREPERRAWRNGLALTYVLVPALRPRWDAADLHGHLAVARRLAAAVVAEREGRGRPGELDLPDPGMVRAVLPLRLAVELALGLEAAGRPEGGELLEALGTRGRDAVRAMAAGGAPHTRSARSLLAAVPAPPPSVTDVGVLGPLQICRDGEAVTDGDIRRERVRELLAFLVGHRTTTRAAITAALWPDLDERAAANNLRVTTNYLKRLLEPWRAPNDPSYFVRGDGATVTLVTGDRLRIDADLFDGHLARAARAEADGTPSLALEHSLAAVDLYRGQAHDGVADAEWVDVDRDHFRSRFVAAATRGGELLLGLDDLDRAEQVARRAVAADPWAEDAHGVLVAAALARGDRSAARRALDRSLGALADLGVDPSPRTQSLRRRVRGAGASA
ncbi:MAG TPA: BTAD domain-containing putative transcriptional regulator [Acidimicrobiales bacterium]|nr:BTAD domain-containing putative transcriptional regulator [Acidimicrobiales bacterium]